MQGEVTQVHHSKQGTQITVETEDESRVMLIFKDPAYAVYAVSQQLTISVTTTPAP